MRRLNKDVAYPKNLIIEILDPADSDNITDDDINNDMISGLNFILKSLDEREQKMIHLRYAEGYTYQQISEEFYISKSSPGELIRRYLRKLRHHDRKKYVIFGLEFWNLSEQEENRRIERVQKTQQNNAREMLLEDLDEISVRTYNCLYRKGLDTIGKVLDFKDNNGSEWYRSIPNFGVRALCEITNILDKHTNY